MTAFDVICVVGAICGFAMVLGGLYLFNRGILTLDKADKQEAVSMEFKDLLKIQSRYPAYGFFIFGLAFMGWRAWSRRAVDSHRPGARSRCRGDGGILPGLQPPSFSSAVRHIQGRVAGNSAFRWNCSARVRADSSTALTVSA